MGIGEAPKSIVGVIVFGVLSPRRCARLDAYVNRGTSSESDEDIDATALQLLCVCAQGSDVGGKRRKSLRAEVTG